VAEVSRFVVGLRNPPADSLIRLEVLPATILQDAGNAPLDDVDVLQVKVVTRQRVGVVESQPAAANCILFGKGVQRVYAFTGSSKSIPWPGASRLIIWAAKSSSCSAFIKTSSP
jgi:hypothetical protein